MKGQFFYTGATETFKTRQLLGKGIEVFHRGELERAQLIRPSDSWNVTLGENLIFNAEGLALITQALDQYKGPASMLSFSLRMDPVTFDLYYSLQKATEGKLVIGENVVEMSL